MRPIVRTIIATILVLVLVLIAIYVFRHSSSRNEPTATQEPRPIEAYDRLLLSGVDYSSYFQGKKIFSVQAEGIVHRKRKVGPLTINPVKEIEMTKVRIEVNSELPIDDSEQDETDFLSIPFQQMLNEVTNDRKLGLVSRAILKELDLIITIDGEESFSLSSDRVLLKAGATRAEFEGGFLARSGGDELFSKEAVWDNDSREIRIEGNYVFKTEKGVDSGPGGRFSIDRAGKIAKRVE